MTTQRAIHILKTKTVNTLTEVIWCALKSWLSRGSEIRRES